MKASPAPVVSTDATSKGGTSSVPSSLAKRHPRSPLVMTTRLTPCAIRNCAHSFASPAVSTGIPVLVPAFDDDDAVLPFAVHENGSDAARDAFGNPYAAGVNPLRLKVFDGCRAE